MLSRGWLNLIFTTRNTTTTATVDTRADFLVVEANMGGAASPPVLEANIVGAASPHLLPHPHTDAG